MSTLSRRKVLIWGCLGSQALVAGCGGGGSSDSPAGQVSAAGAPVPAPAPAPVAAPAPVPVPGVPVAVAFVAGANRSIDLNETLPADVPRGGSFSLDVNGASLPAGMSLAANGLLSISSTALTGVTTGLVFKYTTA